MGIPKLSGGMNKIPFIKENNIYIDMKIGRNFFCIDIIISLTKLCRIFKSITPFL